MTLVNDRAAYDAEAHPLLLTGIKLDRPNAACREHLLPAAYLTHEIFSVNGCNKPTEAIDPRDFPWPKSGAVGICFGYCMVAYLHPRGTGFTG